MPRASDLLSNLAHAPVTDAMVETKCPDCKQSQRLNRARLSFADPMRMAYICVRGCDPILIIGLAIDLTWPSDRGVRVGAYSLRNLEDLIVHLEGEADIVIPANRNAWTAEDED
jgi:hypothetical protein